MRAIGYAAYRARPGLTDVAAPDCPAGGALLGPAAAGLTVIDLTRPDPG